MTEKPLSLPAAEGSASKGAGEGGAGGQTVDGHHRRLQTGTNSERGDATFAGRQDGDVDAFFFLLFCSDLLSADEPSGEAAGRPRRGAGCSQGARETRPTDVLSSLYLFSLPPSSLDLLLWDSTLLRHSSISTPKKLIIKLHLKPPLILHLLRAQ